MPSFAYSIARLRVMAWIPPFVIMAIEAVTPAIGCSTSVVVMLTMNYGKSPQQRDQLKEEQ
jgi:hypothetical protein